MSEMSMQSGVSSPQVSRESIQASLKMLEEEVNQSHDRLSTLAERLSPVLAPAAEKPVNPNDNASPNMNSEMLTHVQKIGRTVYNLNSRITAIIQGLDL